MNSHAVKFPPWLYTDTSYYYSNITSLNKAFQMNQSGITIVFTITRESNGLVLRYAFPLFLMSLLSGAMFWAKLEDRSFNTLTILLALATFSIVVYTNVPQVGYLTVFDEYILSMFIIITFCVVLHITGTLLRSAPEKLAQWPLRNVYIQLNQYIGRTIIIPIIDISYLVWFKRIGHDTNVLTILVVIILSPLYSYVGVYMESLSLLRCIRRAASNIDDKFRYNKILSLFEILFVNIFYYNKISYDGDYHRRILIKKDNDMAIEMNSSKARIAE
jgi:hypothetical protein